MSDGLLPGADGALRCWWGVSTPDYVRYHDEEWGVPERSDRALYEKLCLEAFQSGLSWLTILRKREAFRAAFADFEPAAVAAFGDEDVARLMADAGIVRNRAKIEAAIANARATVELDSLSDLLWSFAPRRAPGAADDGGRARGHPRVHRDGQGAQAPRLPLRRPHDGLRADAGVRAGQRPPGRMPGEVSYSRLLSHGPEATARELLAEVRPRERAAEDRPFVFVNMVSTVDGRAQVEGRTGELGEDADLEMLLELRTLADAVLIGTGTLRAESYGRLVGSEERRAHRASLGLPGDPTAVLLTRGLDLRWDAGLFSAPEQPVLVYTGEDADGEVPATAAPVELVRLAKPSPAAMLADLRARGVRALLTEGGPTLNSALLADGLVDELFLTIAPLITGEPEAIRIVEGDGLPAHVRARPVWVLRAHGELFLRYAL